MRGEITYVYDDKIKKYRILVEGTEVAQAATQKELKHILRNLKDRKRCFTSLA